MVAGCSLPWALVIMGHASSFTTLMRGASNKRMHGHSTHEPDQQIDLTRPNWELLLSLPKYLQTVNGFMAS